MLKQQLAGVLLTALSTLSPATAYAQDEQCQSCVGLELVAELSTSAAPIVPSRLQSVLRTQDGRLFVSHRFVDVPQIVAYDSSGTFLRLYDATGNGPGEFASPPSLFPASGDGVWALERNRLLHFDSGLRHIDTKNLGVQFFVSDLIILSDSTLVLTGRTSAPDDSLFSVSLMDTSWRTRRNLERPPDRYGLALIAAGFAGGFWTLGSNELLLRKYSDGGALSDSVEIVSPYFKPWHGPLEGGGYEGFDVPPRPRHTAVSDLGADRIILLTRSVDEDWTPTPSDRTFNPAERDENALYDTILSVVDASSGRTISTKRVEEYLQPVNGAPDLVFSTAVDGDGHVITKIYRLSLRNS